jgi:peptidoglycan hydrolase-like protein with peptidoglycan-binding domain
VLTGKGSFLATLALGGLCAAIVVNAVVGQTGRHPAPMIATKSGHIPATIAQALEDGDTARMTLAQFARHSDVTAPESQQRMVVAAIQQQLTDLGNYEGEVDGLPGPKTEEAIKAYQRKHDLQVDGKATAELLDRIRFNRRIAEIAKPSVPDPRVQLVQSGLSELGYSPGPVDGLLGDQTRDAIRKFERDRRLPASGEISVRLIDELRKITGLSVLSALESAR